MKETTTIARLHLSQPLWRRIRSSIVMGVDEPLKPGLDRRGDCDGRNTQLCHEPPGRRPKAAKTKGVSMAMSKAECRCVEFRHSAHRGVSFVTSPQRFTAVKHRFPDESNT